MKIANFLFWLISYIFSSAAVFAEDAKPPSNPDSWASISQCKAQSNGVMDCFLAAAQYGWIKCGLQAKLASQNGDWKSVSDCVAQAQSAVKPYYAELAKIMGKNHESLNVLKDTYAFWSASIDSINPDPDETKGGYETRQVRLNMNVQVKLKRLELEK